MTRNILFLCTHNSARSVLGEALASTRSGGRLRGFSAGSAPSGRPNPFAVEQAVAMGFDAALIRSKSWDEFAAPGAPAMDIVVTVCDAAAGEACPFWPGAPLTAHWGMPDPSQVPGDDETKRWAFRTVRDGLAKRLDMLLALPFETMATGELRSALKAIGQAGVLAPEDAARLTAR